MPDAKLVKARFPRAGEPRRAPATPCATERPARAARRVGWSELVATRGMGVVLAEEVGAETAADMAGLEEPVALDAPETPAEPDALEELAGALATSADEPEEDPCRSPARWCSLPLDPDPPTEALPDDLPSREEAPSFERSECRPECCSYPECPA